MGIIHHHKNEKCLEELTRYRCMASVPFGGRYRLVDFILSNMVNSGIANVGIVTSINFRSLLSHLGNGKEWGLDKKHDGLFYLPTAARNDVRNLRKVDLEDLYANGDYIKESKQEYVIITGCNMICNIDLKKAMTFHLEKQADVTVIYKENYRFDAPDIAGNVFVETDENRRIRTVTTRYGKRRTDKVSLGIYVMEKKVLLDILEDCARKKKWDLVKNVLSDKEKDIRIYGYAHDGYLAIINSVNSYYKHHLDLLEPRTLQELFLEGGEIYTKMKDGPSTKYYDVSDVRNILVSNGCLIQGKVENSIIYRNVKVAKGASIKNSIIMPKVEIDEDAVLNGVILDKYVYVRKGARLVSDNQLPIIVGKRGVV